MMSDYTPLNENTNIYNGGGPEIFGSEKINETEFDLLDSDENKNYQEFLRLRKPDKNIGAKSTNYSRRRGKIKNRTEYEVFHQEQFEIKDLVVSWKAMGYTICLFLFGTSVLIAWYFISTSYIDKDQYVDNLQPFTLFASLILIPGSYRIYIVVKEYFTTPGYSFENIVDCN